MKFVDYFYIECLKLFRVRRLPILIIILLGVTVTFFLQLRATSHDAFLIHSAYDFDLQFDTYFFSKFFFRLNFISYLGVLLITTVSMETDIASRFLKKGTGTVPVNALLYLFCKWLLCVFLSIVFAALTGALLSPLVVSFFHQLGLEPRVQPAKLMVLFWLSRVIIISASAALTICVLTLFSRWFLLAVVFLIALFFFSSVFPWLYPVGLLHTTVATSLEPGIGIFDAVCCALLTALFLCITYLVIRRNGYD